MRISFLTFTVVALIASTMTAASAFNYASLSGRTVSATIVADNNAYLAIASQDADHACFVNVDGTTGKIDVVFDNGCAAQTGSGINPGSTVYFHDLLKITNKGTKAITFLQANLTGTGGDFKISIKSATGQMRVSTPGDWVDDPTWTSSIAPGSSIYLGFKVDAADETLAAGSISTSMTIDAVTALS